MAKKKIASKTYDLNEGDKAPRFKGVATESVAVSAAGLAGKAYLIYFYPRDSTPGCTLEGRDFARLFSDFKRAGCAIFGASGDSLKSHDAFSKKYEFPFPLIADEGGEIARSFDVIQTKSMYGRSFVGIERSTFLVDAKGVVRNVWRKVKVTGHAEEVLEAARALKATRA